MHAKVLARPKIMNTDSYLVIYDNNYVQLYI